MVKKIFLSLLFSLLILTPALSQTYHFNPNATHTFAKTGNLTIPRGQIIYSRLNANVDSTTNTTNEIITTQLMKDWIYQNVIIAPEGSLIKGRITNVENSSFAMNNAKVYISFSQIVRPDNQVIPIQTKPICITIGESQLKNSGKMISQSAWNNIHIRNTSIDNIKTRAINGAFAGGVTFILTKGEEVNIPYGTEFKIQIINNVYANSYDN